MGINWGHRLGPESTICTETWSNSIHIGANTRQKIFPRSGDRHWDRKLGFSGPGPDLTASVRKL